MIFISLLTAFAFAANELPGEEIYSAAPSVRPAETVKTSNGETQLHGKVPSQQKKVPQEPGNLPREYQKIFAREAPASDLILPPKGATEIYRALKVGDSISVIVNHSVIAFPDEKAPVVATSNEPRYRGLKFIGESRLEPNTKRIFIEFNRIVTSSQTYQLKAAGLSAEGQPGIEGEHHSRESEYFAGDFISSFVAGYFDGLVPKHSNVFGQIEEDNTIDAATKKGLASGALSSAERFREKLKKVPEFAEIPGPFTVRALVLEQPKTTN